MKKLIAALTALVFVLPALASAQSASTADLQAQAQALLQQVAQLQAQLAAQQGGGTTGATNPVAVTASGGASVNSACPNIGRVLKYGSSGNDVTRLQQFLAADPSVYPQGTVSGYYGALTQAAVQRWQAKYNIVSSGTPASTGYGVVGPRTAAAIALTCSTGASAPVGGYIQVSPISGNAPLNVNVNATVNSTNSCAGAIYQLNWGDGSNPISIPVSANNCQAMSQTYQHQYNTGGTYQIILSSGAHQTSATVTVYGNAAGSTGTTGGISGTTGQSETFTATPTSGSAPLTVTFSGIVTGADKGWCAAGCSDVLVLGDGAQASVPLPTSQTAAQSYTLQHTYTSGGNFTAVLYQGQAGNGRPIVATPIMIAVNGSSSSTSTTATTTSSTYSPPSLSPLYNNDPSSVSLQFVALQCGSTYQLNWGDQGSSISGMTVGDCTQGTPAGQTMTYNVHHTYVQSGNYTITLKRNIYGGGSQNDSIGVSIQ